MTNSMEKELKHGPMVQNMKANTLKERSMEKAHLHLQMVVCTQEISNRMKYQAEADTNGQMERLMKDTGKRIRCMAMES